MHMRQVYRVVPKLPLESGAELMTISMCDLHLFDFMHSSYAMVAHVVRYAQPSRQLALASTTFASFRAGEDYHVYENGWA